MFENETAAVRLGVEFLQTLMEKDYLLDPTFDVLDLESKLNEIQADVNFLIANLPVEAIDDDEEREEEYPGDFEDSEELEDEVVECERLIAQATKLIAEVKEHYLPSDVSLAAASSVSSSNPQTTTLTPTAKPSSKKKKDIDWSFLWIIIILGILIAAAIFA